MDTGFAYMQAVQEAAPVGRMIGDSFGLSESELLGKMFQELTAANAGLKPLNLLVTGKTGVGKSTLINSVFRKKIAQVGNGKPVTMETTRYEVEDVPLRIYDTKGLELDQKAQNETMLGIKNLIREKWNTGDEDQFIHGIWYCINAGSNRVEETELAWIKELCDLGEAGVPVIVVITQSFRKKPAQALKETVEQTLAGNERYAGCVVVLAEPDEDDDEDPPRHPAFGLDDLVQLTFHVIPDSRKRALINAQGVNIDAKVAAAKKYLRGYITSAAAAGALPVPFADAPVLIANEIAMCVHLTTTFGIDLDNAAISGIATALIGVPAATIAGKTIVSGVLKLIPGVGTVLGGVISGGTAALLTAALGRTYIAILEMLARGELKKEDIGTEAFNAKIRNVMEKEMNKKSKDV